MTLFAKRNPVGQISAIFSTDIRPVKISLEAIGNILHPAMLTFACTSEPSPYPRMDGVIGHGFLKKIMALGKIGFLKTLLTAKLSISGIVVNNNFSAFQANALGYFMSPVCKAFFGTKNSLFSLGSVFSDFKLLIAGRAYKVYSISSSDTLTSNGAVNLFGALPPFKLFLTGVTS